MAARLPVCLGIAVPTSYLAAGVCGPAVWVASAGPRSPSAQDCCAARRVTYHRRARTPGADRATITNQDPRDVDDRVFVQSQRGITTASRRSPRRHSSRLMPKGCPRRVIHDRPAGTAICSIVPALIPETAPPRPGPEPHKDPVVCGGTPTAGRVSNGSSSSAGSRNAPWRYLPPVQPQAQLQIGRHLRLDTRTAVGIGRDDVLNRFGENRLSDSSTASVVSPGVGSAACSRCGT